MLLGSNRLSIAGLAFLALAMIGAVMLIADFIHSPALTIASGLAGLGLFGWFWAVMPFATRAPGEDA